MIKEQQEDVQKVNKTKFKQNRNINKDLENLKRNHD